MKSSSVVAAALALAATSAEGRQSQTATPVEKVLQLMKDMVEKGTKEKQAEEIEFSTYKMFCENTAGDKNKMIAEANEKIDLLKADIEKYTSDAANLASELAALNEDVAVWAGDTKAATRVRKIENEEYQAMHKDYSESVDALERAIAVLKAQAGNTAQAASFVQVAALKKLKMIPEKTKEAVEAFLSVGEPGVAHGYEFQSQAIVDTFEKLLDEFIAERTKLEKEESDSKHDYEMLVQDLESSTSEAKGDIAAKSASKAKKLQARADAEGDLTDTTSTRDADQTYLTDLVAECEQKATDFKARQQLRTEELEAVNQAMDIISGGAVAGNAAKHLPTLLQLGQARGSALASLRAESASKSQEDVAVYLQGRAQALGSRVLAALATRVAADPFLKVKKLIKDLIMRLMEEAAEETEHKGWCDVELSTNANTRKEKTVAVETLTAEIDQLGASLAVLAEDIAELTKAVAELDAAVLEATKIREAEKATNAETVQDAKDAQTALAQALTVLREFYAKAGQATALVQELPASLVQSRVSGSGSLAAPYQGMGGESGGVIGMLEVIESDFGRLQADTETAEANSQEEFRKFIEESKIDKEGKLKDIEHKKSKEADQKKVEHVKSLDLEGTQKEMTAAIAYYDKLKPDCVDSGETFEDRVARRKEEIESLQTALRILNGEDIAR